MEYLRGKAFISQREADAITAIRTQLAEVKQLYEICKEQLHYASRRADRAEADLQAMTLLKEKAEKALNALSGESNQP